MSYSKGARRERELLSNLNERGYVGLRAPSSGSTTQRELPDIIAGKNGFSLAIEVKDSSKDKIYVDKTKFLYKIVADNTYYFLSRPRRFGKSLTISMLECFYSKKYMQDYETLFNKKWDLVVADEAHKLKNRKTQQTQGFQKLTSKRMALLTGSPLLNSPEEIWSLLNILFPSRFGSYWQFVEDFCQTEYNPFAQTPKIIGVKNKRELHFLVNPLMINRKKEDVLADLPEKRYQTIKLKMDDKQEEIYRDLEENMFADLGDDLLLTSTGLEQLLRLKQIALSPQLLDADQVGVKIKTIKELLNDTDKKVVICFLESEKENAKNNKIEFTNTLRDAALKSVEAAGIDKEAFNGFREDEELKSKIKDAQALLNKEQKYFRGLFGGGTLCAEALYILRNKVKNIKSNIAKKEEEKLEDINNYQGNVLLDMGEDEFTVGKPHPMIEPSLRNQRILKEAEDPEVGVILLDFELGFGSHSDPAGAAVSAIKEAGKIAAEDNRKLVFVAYICGTKSDYQNYDQQKQKLKEAGVIIAENNVQAAQMTAEILN